MPDFVDNITPYLEGASLTASLLDWAQTRKISKNPEKYYEKNTFLGEHPSTRDVDKWFAGSLLAKKLGSEVMPKKWKPYFEAATLAHELKYVMDNKKLGLDIDKKTLASGLLLTYLMGQSEKGKREEEKTKLSPTMVDKKIPGVVFTKKF